MKNFRTEGTPRRGGFGGGDRGGRGGFGGGDRGGRGGFGGRDANAPRVMHQATCAECNKICEVPFKPTGEKPVFCSHCFANHRPEERSNRPAQFSMDRQARPDRPQPVKADNGRLEEKLEAISVKLDKLVTLLTEKSDREIKTVNQVKEVSTIPKKAEVEKKATPKKVAKKKAAPKKVAKKK